MSVESPRLTDLNRYDVTLEWKTDRPVIGSVKYRSADTDFKELTEEPGEAKTEHRLKIGGLQSDTLYDYSLSGSPVKYSFKTAPGKTTAFRFMVYPDDDLSSSASWKELERHYNTHLPDFIVLLTPPNRTPSSDLAAKTLIHYVEANSPLKLFSYGNADLLFDCAGRPAEELAAQINPSSSNHVFVISSGTKPVQIPADGAVLIYSGKDPLEENSLNLPVSKQILIVDIDGDGITATRNALDNSESEVVTVKETPESVKRSCVYCRKLLEAKKYEDSINWYRDFIAKYETKYIVDDAQFQIANIYDRYLYDYKKAFAEYTTLIEKFPDSTKIKQARQRIEYINRYSDYDFAPLAVFEKTKSEVYKDDKLKAIRMIEETVAKYPDAKLLNPMLFWLAHTLSMEDLDKSIHYHKALLERTDGQEKKETLISMGDVFYENKKYPEAIAAYTESLSIGSDKFNFGVQDKINKSQRNIKREWVLDAALILLGLASLGGLLIKPRFLIRREIITAAILLALLLVIAYSAWWIFYQNYPEIAEFIPNLFLLLASSHLIAAVYSRKIFSRFSTAVNGLMTTLLLLFLNALLFYVFLYYHHYLPSLGL